MAKTTTASSPLVSIVLINWNGLENTKLCLESLSHLTYDNYEIVVVDNGSRQDSKDWLSQQTGFTYVDNATNRGFTGGHIDGFNHAKGEIIMLLNNDAVVKPDIVSRAVAHFEADDVFAVGGRAYQWNDELPAYDESNLFYSFQEINPITAEARTMSADLGVVQEVNNVSGSAVFVSRRLIDEIGYLYDPFFTYFEETDLFARAKRAGLRVLYDPTLMIWHLNGAASLHQPIRPLYMMFRNRWVFALRNFDRPFLRRFVRRHTKTAIKSLVFGLIRRDKAELAQFRGFVTSLLMTPRTLLSRRALADNLTQSYNRKIFTEAPTPASLIIDGRTSLAGLTDTLDSIADQLDVATDTVVIASSKTLAEATYLTKDRRVRVALDNGTSGLRVENFGVPLAKNDWLVFLQPGDTLPSNYLVELLFVALKRSAQIVYATDAATPDPIDFWQSNPVGRIYLVSKPFLLDAGGYDNDVSPAEAHHRLLAVFAANRAGIIPVALPSLPNGRELVAPTTALAEDFQFATEAQARTARRKRSGYERFRRVYHAGAKRSRKLQWLVTFIEWLFEPQLKFRPKLGRLRLLAVSLVSGKRKQISLELRHIRTELLRAHARDRIEADFDAQQTPIFIICRDRLGPLLQLIDWLERNNFRSIYLVDNDSTYPTLLEYFADTPYQVLPLGRNAGHTSPWSSGAVRLFAHNQFYVVTDPDVIPVQESGPDTLDFLHRVLTKYYNFAKAGLGLKIDDLPDHYILKAKVIEWENQFWQTEIESGLYEAGVDTTFALYQPGTPYLIHPSIRTGEPYVARHLPWYTDSNQLTEEDVYYRRHAEASINSWDSDALRDRYSVEMEPSSKKASAK